MQCRICFDDGTPRTLLTPCRCRGTSSYIHRSCLDEYIRYYPDRICRVCHDRFLRYESTREIALCWFVFVALSTLLFLSGARLLVKLTLLTLIGGLSLYYLHRNLFSTTPLVFLSILVLLFLPGGHPMAIYSWLTILGAATLLYTLIRQLPAIVVLGILVTLMLSGYVVFLTVLAYHTLDPPAFTVFLSVLYMVWYIWVHDHPLRYRLA
jgi:hypothetical protein